MKQIFENPELDVIEFGMIDIITTSPIEDEKGGVSTPEVEVPFNPNA